MSNVVNFEKYFHRRQAPRSRLEQMVIELRLKAQEANLPSSRAGEKK